MDRFFKVLIVWELASLTEFPGVHVPLRALARRRVGQRRHGEPRPAPALEPTDQRMDALEAVRRQAEGRLCARRLSGLLAVEDQLAAPRIRWCGCRSVSGVNQRAPGIPYGAASRSSPV